MEAENSDDYATLERLAIYLEIGWSDFLFSTKDAGNSDTRLPYPNPLRDHVAPNFPRCLAELTRKWANDLGLNAKRYCDVGGATGRTVREIENRFPGLSHLALVEPSPLFCDWAERLLMSDAALPDIPVVDRAGVPRWIKPNRRPTPVECAADRLGIFNETLERHAPVRGYDLVTCLNVVDRHPCPADAINSIERCMNDGALLVISSPFDFHEEATPDLKAWIEDLNSLFVEKKSWRHVGETELYYEYRANKRTWTRFSTQVVGKRWNEPK